MGVDLRKRWALATGVSATVVAVAVILAVVVRDRRSGSDYERLSADEILARVQRAVARKGSYRVAVSGHNLVLPQWGGIESGVVNVNLDGPLVSASLQRTGDGLYKMRLVDGQTYFQRGTCSTLTRVPGGGPDVLAPFVLADLSLPASSRGSGSRTDNESGPPVILVTVPKLGNVALRFDTDSYLPASLKLVRDSQDAPVSEWEFSRWGEDVRVEAPQGEIPENGPGGNPC